MIELQQNRYLWVHFAGLAFVPLLLDICLAGLASAGPALPFGGQFWAIALFGITPALAMQWLKPFYVFSLPPSALKPAVLSEDQRRCLQIFKSWQIKALAVAVAIFSLWLLVQMYAMAVRISPLLTPRAGLGCAAIAFFTASTFMQISVSAGRALLIGPSALKRVAAVEESVIARDFLILGFRLNKLLPDTVFDSFEDTASIQNTTEKESNISEVSVSKERLPDVDTSLSDKESTTDSDVVIEDESVSEKVESEPRSLTNTGSSKSLEDLESRHDAGSDDSSLEISEKESELEETVDVDEEPEIIYPEKLPPEGDIDS